MSVKEGYFQGGGGVNEPTPKKKKYKSEPALVVQPRFKEPFFRNYDLYNTPGEHSPGAGYHDMEKYKSVQEFLKAKRKRRKGKYKAEDSWQQDDGKRTKKNPNIKARAALFSEIIKTAGPNYDLGKGLYENMDKYDSVEEFRKDGPHGPGSLMDSNDIDFPIDDQVTGIYPEEGALPGSEIGERLPLTEHDLADRSPEALNFGRDYDSEELGLEDDILQKLFNKYLAPSDTGLFGLPDGVDMEGHDAEPLMDVEEPFTGTSDIGTNIYEDKWNI
jgi:hypothetical protein